MVFEVIKKKRLYRITYLLLEFSYNCQPRNFHMAAAQPLPKRRLRLTGMTELASNCGDTYVDLTNCSVRSELGFDVQSGMFLPPNPIRHKNARNNFVPHKKRRSAVSKRGVTTPVDPAGPHCYRDRTKTCQSCASAKTRHGAQLSNTWLTCPQDENNPGKLGLMLDR